MGAPSALVLRFAPTLAEASGRGAVVDVACGRGRNALALARGGVPVLGLDRSADHLARLASAAREQKLPVSLVRSDLEAGTPPPLAPGRCSAIVVCRYLHRPLCPRLEELLCPGGWLLYETFTLGQRELGHGPRNPAFLLEPDELPTLFPRLGIVECWEGLDESGERPAALARLVARRPPAPAAPS